MDTSFSLAAMAGKLLPLLFNMMGPIGVIPAFAALTAKMDHATQRAIALRAALLSLAALAVAVFLGAAVLDAWGISKGSLVLAGGLIVTLSALQPLFFRTAPQKPGDATTSPRELAASPLAFPTIVSPKAIGVLIIFVAYLPGLDARLTVFGIAAAMLVLDVFGMLGAHWFMRNVGMVPLLVLGAVFGVLQVALGVEMVANGWQALAVR